MNDDKNTPFVPEIPEDEAVKFIGDLLDIAENAPHGLLLNRAKARVAQTIMSVLEKLMEMNHIEDGEITMEADPLLGRDAEISLVCSSFDVIGDLQMEAFSEILAMCTGFSMIARNDEKMCITLTVPELYILLTPMPEDE